MERADYVHMARLSEQASAEDSKAYRRSVAFFAALGYVWVMACVLVAVLILAYIGKSMWQGQFRVAYAWGLPGAGGLLWTSLQASRCIVRPDDVPARHTAGRKAGAGSNSV